MISGDGLLALAYFQNIYHLSLSGNALTDDTVKIIEKIQPKGFIFLGLSRNRFTD